MKKNYLLILSVLAMFSFNSAYSQFCPPTGFSDGSALYFFYSPGAAICDERPNMVSVGASEFSLTTCEPGYAIYTLTAGDALSNINIFVADFGVGTCEYTNGSLTQETLSISVVNQVIKSTRVFPNPLTAGNTIQLVFNENVKGKASMFDITGKKLLSIEIDNLRKKQVDVSSLTNGVYLIQIEAGSSIATKKVVIMK
ncbi:MAG TPA: T9SS type A sorting domain-containing protein [Xanthomarina sp.]|nr:T9SS type A sorting domain-containing protein [Xanthomarina sp.]